jgi:alpha-tubulin suppressor-like RCC1 family protein
LIARDFGEGTLWTLLGSGSAIATDWPAEVTRVSIGRGHQCVLSPGSGVRSILACWGENGRGQAGQPVDAEAPTVDAPAAVAQAITALDVVAFGRSTCVLDEDHRVWCAGANFGDSHVWRAVPALDGLRTLSGAATAPDEADAEAFELCGLDGAAPAGIACSSLTFEGDGFRQVSVAAGYACAVTEDFGVTCVGDARAAAPTDLPQVLEVAVTDDRACAISVDGDIWCWGGAPWSTVATILPLQPPPTDAE